MSLSIFFVLIVTILIILQKKKEGNWVNLVSILTAPYAIIVFINNFILYKKGFYRISDQVLLMLLGGFVLFFAGGSIFNTKKSLINREEDNTLKFEMYNIELMNKVLIIIGVLGLIKIILLYRDGSFSSANIDTMEGVMGNGLVGHLLLASDSILPIVFLYWTYSKKMKYLISIILIGIVTFSSLVKYNIIGMFVSMFLFILIYRKELLKKALVILLSSVVAVFMANYIITFMIKKATVVSAFYWRHLWAYISGSLLYDNYIFTNGIRTDVGIGYKLMTFISAFPNMFITKMGGNKIFPHVRQNDLRISSFGETSNVVDAIGYIFPSKGDYADIILFGLVMFLLGAVFTFIYRKHMNKKMKFDTFISNFLTYFVFFSFFGTFYVNSAPWEILIYSAILPSLFIRGGLKIYV